MGINDGGETNRKWEKIIIIVVSCKDTDERTLKDKGRGGKVS